MSGPTKIEWTDATWNPIRGCSRVSSGCEHCYAERQASRFSGPGQPFEGLARDGRWTGRVELIPEKLSEPLRWRKPRRVFVNSMSDLFHEGLTFEDVAAIFGVMAASPTHTFQVLTKRPAAMRRWFDRVESQGESPDTVVQRQAFRKIGEGFPLHPVKGTLKSHPWPLPNVHLGVSVEDQATADVRIPLLLQTPAAVRFVSVEPMLGPVDIDQMWIPLWWRPSPSTALASGMVTPDMPAWTRIGGAALDWVIVGGESGPNARPCEVGWIRSIVEQCRAAMVPCFVKQLGARPYDLAGDHMCPNGDVPVGCYLDITDRKGSDPAEWPADLRVREEVGP